MVVVRAAIYVILLPAIILMFVYRVARQISGDWQGRIYSRSWE